MLRTASFILVLLATVAALAQQPVASHAGTKWTPAPRQITIPGDPNKIIAKVNGAAIDDRDLQEQMRRMFPFYSVHGGKVPEKFEGEIREKAINELVVQELAYQEALRRKLVVPAPELQKALRANRADFPSEVEYKSFALARYGSVPAMEKRVQRLLLLRKLWDLEVTNRSTVTPIEIRRYYAENKSRFQRPDSVSLQSITILLPLNATPAQKTETKKRAQTVLQQAKATKNYDGFGALAEANSQDDWRVMMGDHRWVHKGTLDPGLETVAFQLKAGEVSNLIEEPDRYIILRANARQQAGPVPYAELKDKLRDELQRAKRKQRMTEYTAQLRKAAKVEIAAT